MSRRKKGMKLLVFTIQFWFKRSLGKNNNKRDNKYNNSKY